MRWIVIVASLALLSACEHRIVSSSPTEISIEGGEFARNAQAIAEAHCAQFGKTPRLMSIEPMLHVTWIHHYDCI